MQVKIQNLSKTYKEKQVLQDISFDIKSGTVCGLLGVNGAGKSTLMKILFGLISADTGKIFFDGQEKTNNQLGALIEAPAIYMNLSAFDNLKTKALLFGISDKRIHETLEVIGLAETGKKRAGKFSLGMKQRLGIGMAILTEPQFLILDEPTNGLDPDGIAELLNLILKLKAKGVTILISSHQLHEISKVASQIIILNKGKIHYNHANNKEDDIEQLFFKIVHGGM
ncbi:ABC transporter ATP-binding protein [Lactococcus lactis]|uniref:ABC transporter ATP-binding protein n=1 Tax=Lactococcus lactis TaxID=1358 RepID=UPI00071D18D1|nr:ABC transporter ATP-binding protein [Lactococcus lactis]KSU17537.1 hypothetical protein LMG14418_1838 [Lactococcus lactis subsp. lactis]USI61269.1 ABC transporter ATP-binding protein [Lactococcus lactis subsp. lactis]